MSIQAAARKVGSTMMQVVALLVAGTGVAAGRLNCQPPGPARDSGIGSCDGTDIPLGTSMMEVCNAVILGPGIPPYSAFCATSCCVLMAMDDDCADPRMYQDSAGATCDGSNLPEGVSVYDACFFAEDHPAWAAAGITYDIACRATCCPLRSEAPTPAPTPTPTPAPTVAPSDSGCRNWPEFAVECNLAEITLYNRHYQISVLGAANCPVILSVMQARLAPRNAGYRLTCERNALVVNGTDTDCDNEVVVVNAEFGTEFECNQRHFVSGPRYTCRQNAQRVTGHLSGCCLGNDARFNNPNVDYGLLETSRWAVGSDVTLTCNEGYAIGAVPGETTFEGTCDVILEGRTFSTVFTRGGTTMVAGPAIGTGCDRVTCSDTQIDPFGTFEAGETLNDGVVDGTITCNSGRHANGVVGDGTSYSVSCLSTGTYDDSVRCELARCFVPSIEPNASPVGFTGFVNAGSSLRYVCDAENYVGGVELDGSTFDLACGADGTFGPREGAPCLTRAPTEVPTAGPTAPTAAPTAMPTDAPTSSAPTATPTSSQPTTAPTTLAPTNAPTTSEPTSSPTTSCINVIRDNNATMFGNENAAPGEAMTLVCNEHYAIAANPARGTNYSVVCQHDGVLGAFQTFTDRCERVECLPPPVDIHANPFQTYLLPADLGTGWDADGSTTFRGQNRNTVAGGSVEYTCSTGTGVAGVEGDLSYSINCLDDGAYTVPVAVCEPLLPGCIGAPADENAYHNDRAYLLERVTYTCKNAHGVDGSIEQSYSLLCQASGRFEDKVQSCEPIQCTEASLVVDYNALVTTNIDGSRTFSCESDYTAGGVVGQNSYNVLCDTRTGHFASNPAQCELPRCGTPPSDTHATRSSESTLAGSSITYLCRTYFGVGGRPAVTSYNVRCRPDGTFATPIATCAPINCSVPDVANAAASNTSVIAGASVTYTCASGFGVGGVHQATFDATCLYTGRLSVGIPDCVQLSCGASPIHPNSISTMHYGGVMFGTRVIYTCNEGYGIGGSPRVGGDVPAYSVRCDTTSATGGVTFNPEDISQRCQQIFCNVPTEPHADTATVGPVPAGTVVQYTCANGFGYRGQASSVSYRATCSDTGVIGLLSRGCEPVSTCADPPVDGAAAMTMSRTAVDTLFTYTCNAGFGVRGSHWRHSYVVSCSTSSGVFGSRLGVCTPIQCTVPTVPGTVPQSDASILAGESVRYTCLPFHTVSAAGAEFFADGVSSGNGNDVDDEDGTHFTAHCNNEGTIAMPQRAACEQASAVTCSAYGDGSQDSHFVTFDGDTYDWRSDCAYTLIRDCAGGLDFEVQVGPVARFGHGVNFALAIQLPNSGIVEMVARARGATLRQVGDNQTMTLPYADSHGNSIRPLSYGSRSGAVAIRVASVGATIFWNAGASVVVRLDPTSPLRQSSCGACSSSAQLDTPILVSETLFRLTASEGAFDEICTQTETPAVNSAAGDCEGAENYCSDLSHQRYSACGSSAALIAGCKKDFCSNEVTACESFGAAALMCSAAVEPAVAGAKAESCVVGTSLGPYRKTCLVTGGQHFITFDGFSFDGWGGRCTHTLIKQGDFEVQVKNSRRVDLLSDDDATPQVTWIDGVVIALPGGADLELFRGVSSLVHRLNNATLPTLPYIDEHGNSISYARGPSDSGASLNIFVRSLETVIYWNGRSTLSISSSATGPLVGNVEGLCGNFDGDAADSEASRTAGDRWLVTNDMFVPQALDITGAEASCTDIDVTVQPGCPSSQAGGGAGQSVSHASSYNLTLGSAEAYCADLNPDSPTGPYAGCMTEDLPAQELHDACVRDYCTHPGLACESVLAFDRLCRATGVAGIPPATKTCSFVELDTAMEGYLGTSPPDTSADASESSKDEELMPLIIAVVVLVVIFICAIGFTLRKSSGNANLSGPSVKNDVANPAFVP